MKSYHLETFGSIEGVVQRESEIPTPGKHEVLVRMHANALNYRDLMVVQGIPIGVQVIQGLVPLSDGAGEIIGVGKGVSRFAVGDRVVTHFRQNWINGERSVEGASQDLGGGMHGVLREYAVFNEEGLVSLPDYLSYEAGATLTCAGLTAWNAVIVKGGLRLGQTVLVQGCGGVSLFALQLAKACGARVIAITSSPEKERALIALGADATVNYSLTPEWHIEVLKLTGNRGVDLAVEVTGERTLHRSLQCVRIGGRIVLVGARGGVASASGSWFGELFAREINLGSVRVGSRTQLEQLVCTLEMTRIHPVIDRSFTFDQALDAYRYFELGSHIGKVVITYS